MRGSPQEDAAGPSRHPNIRWAELRPAEVIDMAAIPRILRRVLGLACRYPAYLGFATLATLGSTAMSLLLPRLLGHSVDRAHALLGSNQPFSTAWAGLASGAALILGASILRGILRMIAGYLGESVGQRVGYDLRLAFFDKLQRPGFDFHDGIHSGDLITRGMLDVEGVRGFIGDGLQRLVLVVMLVSVGAGRLFATDPLMALMALSFVPVVTWQAARAGLFLRVTWTRLQEKMALLTRMMEENLQGVRVVRAFAAERFETLRFDRDTGAALRIARYRIAVRARTITGMQTVFYGAMAMVLRIGSRRVSAGQMTIGELTEILAFMTILQQPTRQIIMIVNSAARATSSGQRLFDVLDRAPRVQEKPDAKALVRPRGALRFEHVDFAYPGGSAVLHDTSFTVEPGRTLGIVGGQDVRSVSRASLGRAVAMVLQEPFLFSGTMIENIRFASDASDANAIAAAKAVRAHGYQTQLTQRGQNLSQDQRQLLSFARALAADPQILILDEATASVDSFTELDIQAALKTLLEGRTSLIIAHRLATVRDADMIIVLQAGRIVEQGNHAALLAQDGLYSALYARGEASFDDGAHPMKRDRS